MSDPPWLDDYEALIAGRGYALLDGWSSVVAAGADAATLLNNFCTNDIPKLSVGDACEAFFPNAKGKVLAFGWVWRTGEDQFRIVLGSDRAASLAEHLDRYVLREDVMLSTVNNPLAFAFASDRGVDDALAVASFGESAALLPAPAEVTKPIAIEAFHAYRIEQASPLDGADVDDRNLPQELGRDATAISFTKGCYLGQETVARIDALGHVNQQLQQLRIEGEAAPRDELTSDGKPVGRLTSVSWSPMHESVIALGYVRRGHAAAGTELLSEQATVSVLG